MNRKCSFCGSRTNNWTIVRQRTQCRTCFELTGMPHTHPAYKSTRFCETPLEEE